MASTEPQGNTAKWFTPTRLLGLFCVMSFLVYVDRGVMSSAAVSGAPRSDDNKGYGLQGDFDVSYASYGALQAAFMLGLLTGAPMFSALAKTWNPFKLIGCGLGGWMVATAGCAVASNYYAFFMFRVFVGLGEASFCALAAPFIDDYAPSNKKTTWLALFYLCIPLGVAGGVMFGGAIGGSELGWRWAFGLESFVMVPVVVFCMVSGSIPMKGVDESVKRKRPHREVVERERADVETDASDDRNDSTSPTKTSTKRDFQSLAKNTAFLVALAGYILYTATIGVYAAWGPKAGYGIYSEELKTPSRSDMVLGGVTVVAGVLGTVLGGLAVDLAKGGVLVAISVCAGSGLAAFLTLECAFNVNFFEYFLVLFTVGQIFAFGVQAPVNAVVLRSVKLHERPLACALVTVFIHLLGDVPTPPLFGVLLEHIAGDRDKSQPSPDDWRLALTLFTLLLALSAGVWGVGAAGIRRLNTYTEFDVLESDRLEQEEHDSEHLEEDASVPFLGEGGETNDS